MAEDLFSSPTPFTPPTSEEDRLAWLRLIRSRRVGVGTFFRLMSEYGTAQAALSALPEIARAAGASDYAPCTEGAAQAEIAAADRAGAIMLCHGEPGYPAALASIPDPPPVLWCIGRMELLSRPMIALVGARNASSLGTRMARRLAEGLGESGFVVVSGMARGIDAAAHHAALDSGTVAVLAGGVDVIYPRENAELAESLAGHGLRLSERPMGAEPQARHFPTRNRLISGLSRAVLVVEGAARSGSLITAKDALEQGREVMAVPGHPMDARASGGNALIRQGATLVRGVSDILEALGCADAGSDELPARTRATAPLAAATGSPRDSAASARALRTAATLHRDILDRLGPSPIAEDQLIRDLDLPASHIAPELLALELDGRIVRQPGGLLARA